MLADTAAVRESSAEEGRASVGQIPANAGTAERTEAEKRGDGACQLSDRRQLGSVADTSARREFRELILTSEDPVFQA